MGYLVPRDAWQRSTSLRLASAGCGPNPEKGVLPIETKVQAVAELEARAAALPRSPTGTAYPALPLKRLAAASCHNGGAPEEKGPGAS